MTLFVALAEWTEQGVRNFWDTTDRVEEAKTFASQFGVELMDLLWTPAGSCHMIAIFEAPDDAAFAAYMLTIESMGGVRVTWTPGYRLDEMQEVIRKSR
ncbi:MAG TPA: GYD domain-containing protein [Spirillospora sp.]|nr:GYD domain-containing protein [Spirillospora sp.]